MEGAEKSANVGMVIENSMIANFFEGDGVPMPSGRKRAVA